MKQNNRQVLNLVHYFSSANSITYKIVKIMEPPPTKPDKIRAMYSSVAFVENIISIQLAYAFEIKWKLLGLEKIYFDRITINLTNCGITETHNVLLRPKLLPIMQRNIVPTTAPRICDVPSHNTSALVNGGTFNGFWFVCNFAALDEYHAIDMP